MPRSRSLLSRPSSCDGLQNLLSDRGLFQDTNMVRLLENNVLAISDLLDKLIVRVEPLLGIGRHLAVVPSAMWTHSGYRLDQSAQLDPYAQVLVPALHGEPKGPARMRRHLYHHHICNVELFGGRAVNGYDQVSIVQTSLRSR
jgi:hypothetical protein